MEKNFLSLFKRKKPIIGMIHLKGDDHEDIFIRFKKEVDIYINNGIDGIIVEPYFGTYTSMERALDYLLSNKINIPYGVNCLNNDYMGFYLAKKYRAQFVQVDSVVGHVKPRDEETFQAFFDIMREEYDGYLIGGVRFKYQPMLSVKSLEEDLEISKSRCDGVCVTETKTGEKTSIEKIKKFKEVLGDFPLIVAAGLTTDNAVESLKIADAAVVGSFFKDTRRDDGELSDKHINELMAEVNKVRNNE